jgi:hypothetical protein
MSCNAAGFADPAAPRTFDRRLSTIPGVADTVPSMIGSDLRIPLPDGVVSGIDFGGSGQAVLLVQGSGQMRRSGGTSRRSSWDGSIPSPSTCAAMGRPN